MAEYYWEKDQIMLIMDKVISALKTIKLEASMTRINGKKISLSAGRALSEISNLPGMSDKV